MHATAHAQRPAIATKQVYRIEVWPRREAGDPRAESLRRSAAQLGHAVASARSARVYLIEGVFDDSSLVRVRERLLADPVVEESHHGARPAQGGARTIEVHPLPGVMDPVALTVRESIESLLGARDGGLRVVTGVRYDVSGVDETACRVIAKRLLANEAIEQVHSSPWQPSKFPEARVADQTVKHVELTKLDDAGLATLSREGHLFLSLEEMRAIRDEFVRIGREPTDVELEALAQTWSEHCVHKTLKSRVTYRPAGHTLGEDVIDWKGRPGHTLNADGSVTIDNLLKCTVAAATHELIADGIDWTLSVFVDNAGIIAFDDHNAICMKVETHNRPSAIEPYGGAATGVGGCIRDIMGTGLGAKPIANTDVFCVAHPEHFFTAEGAEGTEKKDLKATAGSSSRADSLSTAHHPPSATSASSAVRFLPPGCLHPRRILSRVVDGVRDYGNRMGIPTVNGGVFFDDRYVGNPLVFCGCIGIMPRELVSGTAKAGDLIVAVGGRTGRDGIHGATFSSAELTGTHADEFSHAVQIGNAIEEKRVLDALLRARDFVAGEAPGTGHQAPGRGNTRSGLSESAVPGARCLYSAITDCGAGGFSSAVGEMGEKLGAVVDLDRAPLKYAGLRYDEIWISESQERMVVAVPEGNLAALQRICDEERVELAVLGRFGNVNAKGEPELLLRFEGREVGRMTMHFLHDGIPMPTREAVWNAPVGPASSRSVNTSLAQRDGLEARPTNIRGTLLQLLAHPDIASKRWIVNQYDHEVQGNTIIKPLVGPGGIGPGDAAVLEPVAGSTRGIAIACGMQTRLGHPDVPGSDPYIMALAAVDECIRNLVCVGADPSRIAILDNFCWPSCSKPENMASLVRAAAGCYDAAKAYRTPFISGKDSLNNQFRLPDGSTIEIPPTLLISGVGIVPDVKKCVTMDLKAEAASEVVVLPVLDAGNLAGAIERAKLVAALIARGEVLAAHDISEGGALVALAEMVIAADGMCGVDAGPLPAPFAEGSGGYVLQVKRGVRVEGGVSIGVVAAAGRLGVGDAAWPVADLRRAFLGTLDW